MRAVRSAGFAFVFILQVTASMLWTQAGEDPGLLTLLGGLLGGIVVTMWLEERNRRLEDQDRLEVALRELRALETNAEFSSLIERMRDAQ